MGSARTEANPEVILAFLPADTVERVLGLGMPAVTPATIIEPAVMRDHLAEVRRRGYAWDDEERIPGVRCVASPVFGHDGMPIDAVSIAGAPMRMPWERIWQLREEVRTTAATISRRLGYAGWNAEYGSK